MATSCDVRNGLVNMLRWDLVGPDAQVGLAEEELPSAPSRWYLTGFLIPQDAPAAQKQDDDAQEQLDLGGPEAAGDDEKTPEAGPKKGADFPSSMGLSALVSKNESVLKVRVTWGDYEPVGGSAAGDEHSRRKWRRHPREGEVAVPVGKARHTDEVAGSGLFLDVVSKPVSADLVEIVPKGTRAVSVFLVNKRPHAPDDERDRAFAFQARLEVTAEAGFVPRPDVRGRKSKDPDDQVASLQYRAHYEFATGHNTATHADLRDGQCTTISTTWIPESEVERVRPGDVPGLVLDMDTLSRMNAMEATAGLAPLVEQYRLWLQAQGKIEIPDKGLVKTRTELVQEASHVLERIQAGIASLKDTNVLLAFQVANRAMAWAARQRSPDDYKSKSPAWRPFQLAFLLMNLPALADPNAPTRKVVDLLFFPTGGGKTEAYLGLAAVTLLLRRLRNPGISGAGLSVLMRYTLRLLTLDQLGRAATLICALELIRKEDVETWGTWPFEIGLWVGQRATPNRMGKKGDNDKETARERTLAFQRDEHRASPIPLETCPWCNTRFKPTSFSLYPDAAFPRELRITCANASCAFTRDNPLPIQAVDEPIYRRLPCFIIATVDKLAQLPWVGETGALFGHVQRYDGEGFYGPCDMKAAGQPLPNGRLPPPDLIIQDELHLISGPLGTVAGLYEAVVEHLAEARMGDTVVQPKIVASTATVRRANAQIRALFGRPQVQVFPPPGPDLRDSFFAKTVPTSEEPGRLYLGVAAPGRNVKEVLLRVYVALLASAQAAYRANGGKRLDNPADPYMTLLGYFNSLRELGAARRIVEDMVRLRVSGYGSRRDRGYADRKLQDEVVELTSRKETDEVAIAKELLAHDFSAKERVDVALATNMISVGLDITRLGLMVAMGQPKATAEYIQATSRVGRRPDKPGLVVTVLNTYRPRDRSHYERFEAFHQSFYRSVEATSVTPFSPRALDRSMPAVVTSLARHWRLEMTAPTGATQVLKHKPALEKLAEVLADRAELHSALMTKKEAEALRKNVKARTVDLLDSWFKVANDLNSVGSQLQYGVEAGAASPLLHQPLDPELQKQSQDGRKFKAGRSMRSVEPAVPLFLRRLDKPDENEEGGAP